MPLVAQVTGAVALTALIVGPWWASAPDAIPQDSPAITTPALPAATPVPTPPVSTAAPAPAVVPAAVAPPPPAPVPPARPAHLNLDVRHSFKTVIFSVIVDGKPALQTTLEGSGKRFGVFGKRSERGYTKTLDLTPGAHLVRVRVLSTEDKFDQTRVERFDLGSASVATIRIAADKTGLSLVAERPPAPPVNAVVENVAAPPPPLVPAPVAVPIQAATIAVPQAATASRQDVNAIADLLQSVRSMLIAIAGFVASAATGFVVQEYLRSRPLPFAKTSSGEAAPATERRRSRRPGKPAPQPVDEDDFDDDEVLPAGDREPT
jgi:hypothetical protein